MEDEEKRMNEDSDLSKWLDNGKFARKRNTESNGFMGKR